MDIDKKRLKVEAILRYLSAKAYFMSKVNKKDMVTEITEE